MTRPEPLRARRLYLRRLIRRAGQSPALLLIAVITCLAVAAGAVVFQSFSDQMVQDANARLDRDVAEEASALADLLASASNDLRLARQNAIFDSAVAATSGQLLPADRQQVESAIVYMGARYQVDEMCLIRADGLETARWVGENGVAPVSDLSANERLNNPAVVPTLALRDDQVYQTEPYVSPDSHRWVIGLGTPVVLPGSAPAAVLHFEIPIQRLADQLAANSLGGSSYWMVLNQDGQLLVHPRLADFQSQQGLGTNARISPFPVAGGSGSESWQAAVRGMLANSSGSAVFSDGGVTYRASFAGEPGSNRIVAAVSPVTELYADVDRSRMNLAVTVVPLIVLMILVSGLFARRLSASNRRLGFTYDRLAATSRASSELAAIVRAGDDAMFSVDLDGTVATWNDGAVRLYGRTPTEALGSPMSTLFQVDQRAHVPSLLSSVGNGEAIQRRESIHLSADGSPIDVSVTMSPIHGETGISRAAVVVRDISDRKRLEDELAHQALHDALTGLPNRVLFHDRLVHSLARARRPLGTMRMHHAVLFVDLDDFKLINDTFGHRTGDRLLQAVAERIQESLRAGDTAARLGGDEFTILLENVEEGRANAIADRILARLREPFEVDGHRLVVSASIGIALSESANDAPDDLLRSADTALYEAKSNGKGRHETYHPQMNERVWHRMELEADLRRAITANEFVLHYQPIVELETQRVVAVEALLRWQHPTLGLVMPADFLSLAEESGLIVDIGTQVLGTACRTMVELARRIPWAASMDLHFNVSVRELRDPAFVELVRSVLEKEHLPPSRLTLELTETALLDPDGPGAGAITALHDLGIRLCIDDFGAGYSSLGYFRRLPVQAMKIDRVFVTGLGRSREDSAIVAATLAFGTALGVAVTAEGIETPQQLDELLSLHCQYGQGYHFSRPLAADNLTKLLFRGPTLGGRLSTAEPESDAA